MIHQQQHLWQCSIMEINTAVKRTGIKECRISVRGETLYLTMLSAVTPTQ